MYLIGNFTTGEYREYGSSMGARQALGHLIERDGPEGWILATRTREGEWLPWPHSAISHDRIMASSPSGGSDRRLGKNHRRVRAWNRVMMEASHVSR